MTVNINAANISSVQLAAAQTPSAPNSGFVRLHHNANSRLAMRPATGNVVEFLGNTSGSGAGITFPATQSPSSDANTLDDYEEGTWTPAITFSSGTGDLSYNGQVGRYIKVGRLVYLSGFLRFSETTASGNLSITGLPFPADTTTTNYQVGSLLVDAMTGLSGGIIALMGADIAANTMVPYQLGTGTATRITNTNTDSNSIFEFGVTYTSTT